MKRSMADGGGELLTMDLADCLLFLSHPPPPQKKPRVVVDASATSDPFECKTCGRRFPSFQALGGHRASHKLTLKKPSSSRRPPTTEQLQQQHPPADSRMHECSICGLGFSMGQALGGHMRKHRMATMSMYPAGDLASSMPPVVVLKRTNSSKRIAGGLDLNLTPLENDLKLLFGNASPTNIQQQQLLLPQTHPHRF